MNIREKCLSSVKSTVATLATIIMIIGSRIGLSTVGLASTQQIPVRLKQQICKISSSYGQMV